MKIRGIKKGDRDLRHFTFDDDDVVVRAGTYMYKVTYDKNPLEGEYGEEEVGYVECDKVMALGGRKPKPIVKTEEPQKEVTIVKETPVEKQPAKRGRKPKVDKVEPSTENRSVDVCIPNRYEYTVTEIKASNITELQDQLNEKGLNGWELCGFDTNKTPFGPIHIVAVFKRKRG